MRRWLTMTAGFAVLAVAMATPAIADPGTGQLLASFEAGVTGGEAIFFTANGQAAVHAAPGISPDGRLSPLGGPLDVCDTQVVGTWFYAFGPDGDVADFYDVVSYTFDGVELDLRQTAAKPVPQGPFQGEWWFAAGDPVLGALEPGSHEIGLEVTVFGDTFSFTTPIDVDPSHC